MINEVLINKFLSVFLRDIIKYLHSETLLIDCKPRKQRNSY